MTSYPVFLTDKIQFDFFRTGAQLAHGKTRALKCKPSAGDMIVKKPEEWYNYNAVHVACMTSTATQEQ